MKKMKNVIYAVLLVSMGLLVQRQVLACEYQGGGSQAVHNVSFGTITVPADLPVGGIIATSSPIHGSGAQLGGCTSSLSSFTLTIVSGPRNSSVGGYVYNTNIPGVGISGRYSMVTSDLSDAPCHGNTPLGTRDYTGGTVCSYPGPLGIYDSDQNSSQFTLIKTGDISGGSLSGTIGGPQWDGLMAVAYNLTSTNIVAPTCTVQTPNVNIPLGEWNTSAFNGVGSVTTAVPFSISLNCDSGTQVSAQITADADTTQSGTVRVTTGSGAAAGVGVQLLDASNVALGLNQLFVVNGSSASGLNTINWNARYIQTGTTITAGDANAVATVVFTYQ